MSVKGAQYAASKLKQIARRQLKIVGPRRQAMPIRRSEQLRRYQSGEEAWRVDAGLVTPEEYERYVAHMQQLEGG